MTVAEDQLSYNETLNNVDRYWKFKTAFNVILILSGIIGLGCVAWLIATAPFTGLYPDYESYWSTWPSLITFVTSILWCVACVLVFILRKTPMHPGARVAMHLLFWLGFIATALLIIGSYLEIHWWGSNGRIYGTSYYSSSSDGDYRFSSSNNTWVWTPDSDYDSNISFGNAVTRNCSGRNSFFYYNEMSFDTCEEQDAFINKLWEAKPTRENVTMTAVVCQWIGVLLHFVVFVWSCVDCHRFNRKKNNKDAEKIAAGIVQTMITNGAIMPPPGQAYMRPAMGQGIYYQLPSQAYPMQAMPAPQNGMQPQQPGYGYYPMAAPQQQQQQQQPQQQYMPGPSNEKGNGPRYA